MPMTKKAKLEAYDAMAKRNNLLELYLYDSVHKKHADCTKVFTQDIDKVVLRLYRATGALGGYVVTKIGNNVGIHCLDDMQDFYKSDYSARTSNMRIAISRLVQVRNQLCNAR